MMDRYPAEQQRIIKALADDVERLKTIARTVKPIPIKKAEAIGSLPNMTAPSSGSNPVAADQYNRLREDVAIIHEWVKDFYYAMRDAGFIE